MILKKITLSNFTVFTEKQEIDLAPQDTSCPLIVINGHNGSGKTSILTGVQIALFGKRIVTLLDEKKSYTEFLEGISSNKQASSSVCLDFEIYSHGTLEKYSIVREWTLITRGKSYEKFSVYKNDIKDSVLETAWDDFIDTIIPISIASLFFFDGERIAGLATNDGITSLLKTGIYSLLGINTLNQLHTDLGFVLKNKIKNSVTEPVDTTLSTIESDIKNIGQQLAYLSSEISLTQEGLSAVSARLTTLDIEFENSGAKFFADRTSIEKKYELAKSLVLASNEKLLELASGVLPLALIEKRTQRVVAQAKKEATAGSAKQLIDVVENWATQISGLLGNADDETAASIQNFLNDEKNKYQSLAKVKPIFNFPADVLSLLSGLDKDTESGVQLARLELINSEAAFAELEEAQRLEAMIPSEASVKQIITEREQLLEQLRIGNETLVVLGRKQEQLEASLRYKNQELARVLQKIAQNKTVETVDGRVVRYAQKAQLIVEELTQRVVERSRGHLELLIGESMHLLMQKQNFISSIRIAKKDFSLSILGDKGLLDIDRLSAGERQLIVISILWGLTKASGRPLPFIVDTPLGRLDSIHRDNLLECFFPEASHQTILLATDTEITSADYEKICEFVSKTYVLRYNDMAKRTQIERLVGAFND